MNSQTSKRIGYLVPEFPGQTHAFFWREIKCLRAVGIEPAILSTKSPPGGVKSTHAWTVEAESATKYLARRDGFPFLGALGILLLAGPVRWFKCLRLILTAETNAPRDRIRMVLASIVGAHLVHYARRKGLNHVHVHSCANSAHIAMFANLLADLPYSMTLHNPLETHGPNQKQKWKHAAFGIIITQQLLTDTREKLGNAGPALLKVAPMGVELDQFTRSNPYVPCEEGQEFRLFTCCRLNPAKRVQDLIQAIAVLQDHKVPARLVVAGADDSGNMRVFKSLEQMAKELNVSDRIEFIGSVSEDRVREELELSHAFALVSVSEPLGVATMEAMAMRLPVIITNTGGAVELVRNEIDGFWVEVESPAQIADAIRWMLGHPNEAKAMGESGRARVNDQFHSGRSAHAIAECLSEANVNRQG